MMLKKYHELSLNKSSILLCLIFLSFNYTHSQQSFDSLHIKQAKHYFNTVIVVDGYKKPNREFTDTSDALSKRLKSYGIKQTSIYFQTPIYTKDKPNYDSCIIKNTHLLLTGNFVSLRPLFDGISKHNLIKSGIGIRYIYNSGKKGVWFADLSPFFSKDLTDNSKNIFRLASTFLYSHNTSEKLNWRIGITKSFLWGNRYYLPFIGVRIGRLDKTHLSIQFPRNISFNFPIRDKFLISAYSRPQGGVFLFSNNDSLYYRSNVKTFNFTRFEINTGLRFDVRLNTNFNFYFAGGLSTRNSIYFYSDNANQQHNKIYSTYFYSKKPSSGLYFNLGMVIIFGKNKTSYFNRNIYDAIDLGNLLSPNVTGNPEISLNPGKKSSNKNLKSIADLIDYTDF